MEAMFNEKNVTSEQALLIFSFLHQYGVLLPVDKQTALVPSMLSPIPTVSRGRGKFCDYICIIIIIIVNFINRLNYSLVKAIFLVVQAQHLIPLTLSLSVASLMIYQLPYAHSLKIFK